MKKFLLTLIMLLAVFNLTACKDDEIPDPNTGGNGGGQAEPFDPDKEMYDNPEDWPTDTFFSNVPAVAPKVDDLAVVFYGSNNEKQVYTFTIRSMEYSVFKDYTNKLIAAGFNCTRASYWLPDNVTDLSNNYSQCVANSKGVYIKAYWYKSATSSYDFQMLITNYDTDKES